MSSNKKLMIIFSGIFILTVLSITPSKKPDNIDSSESVEKENILIENIPYDTANEEIVFENQLYNPANDNTFINMIQNN